jgi:cyclophilin family peptidyl-prolyl cis-trans isomerase
MRRLATLAAAAVLMLAACASQAPTVPTVPCPTEGPTLVSAQATLIDAAIATVTVSGAVSGEFEIELLPDAAPLATANFVSLARCGFYAGVKFHRVLAGFVIQAGDPNTRDNDGDFEGIGQGGPGYGFEIEPPPASERFDPYTVAMANKQVANGSQWFVTLADLDEALRQVGSYSIFGRVTNGTDVVDAIAAVPVNDPEIGVPVNAVTIDSIVITAPESES